MDAFINLSILALAVYLCYIIFISNLIDSTTLSWLHSMDGARVCRLAFEDGMPMSHLPWLQHMALPN